MIYKEISSIKDSKFRVFRNTQSLGEFFVLPSCYRLTRTWDRSEHIFKPALSAFSVIGNAGSGTVYFKATLQPDIPSYSIIELEKKLLELYWRDLYPIPITVEYHPTNIFEYIEYNWLMIPNVDYSAIKTKDSIQVSLTTDLNSALLVCKLLEEGDITGQISLILDDGSKLHSDVYMGLSNIAGPWEPIISESAPWGSNGPTIVEQIKLGPQLYDMRITNKIERTILISEILLCSIYQADPPPIRTIDERISRIESLKPGNSIFLGKWYTDTLVCPVYSIDEASNKPTIQEYRIFTDDSYVKVIFLNLINYANHDLSHLAVQARIQDVDGIQDVAMTGDPPKGDLTFINPLSNPGQKKVLHFQVKKTFLSGEVSLTPWIEWDLSAKGNVISLIWEMIQ